MADSGTVVDEIDKGLSNTKISVIVANYRGAEKAMEHQQVDILGFPFSISETFQYRNTNKNQEEAFNDIVKIVEILKTDGRVLNLYFSMAFGNPYGEMWKWEEVDFWANRFNEIGIKNILLSDTTGTGTTEPVSYTHLDVYKRQSGKHRAMAGQDPAARRRVFGLAEGDGGTGLAARHQSRCQLASAGGQAP